MKTILQQFNLRQAQAKALLRPGVVAAAAAALSPLGGIPARGAEAPPSVRLAYLPAFPGAEGAGAATAGGRGGRVIAVTNLDDSGPGSLRAAVSAEGPRTIVFRVAGTIALASKISVRNPNMTIAGQTAPGGGICLKNENFEIHTHDVILRYLRVRLGDEGHSQGDAITVWRGSSNVILDHCSASWSEDEVLSLAGEVSNVTVQWCLIAEGLHLSKHAKGPHAYGSLMRASGPVTLHHNLWEHNDSRNPRLGDSYGKPPFPRFDVRNNLIYDYGRTATGLTQGQFVANYVGNYLRPGPSSHGSAPISLGAPSQLQFFLSGNVWEGHAAQSADNAQFLPVDNPDATIQVKLADGPFEMEPVRTTAALAAYGEVLANVGAVLPLRDSVDERLLGEVRRRTGGLVDSQNQVGAWPQLAAGTAPVDTDGDGMPDAWEVAHGLDPRNAADCALDKDGDGYSNLEEFLNGTDPGVNTDYRDPKLNLDPHFTPSRETP